MSGGLIDLSFQGRSARLLLRRPDAGNAFTHEMMRAFKDVLTRARDAADVLVISGEGPDFSLGRDRNDPMTDITPSEAFGLVVEVNDALAAFPGVTLAEVRGRTFGFGVGLILRTDVAIAGAQARFALDEVKLGIPPMFIMAEILDHLSPKQAADLIFSSRELTAAEAAAAGLVSRVVPDDALSATVADLARQLSAREPAVLSATKSYLRSIRRVPRGQRSAYALGEQTAFALRRR